MDETALMQDVRTTIANRQALFGKQNLLYWYRKLYERLLGTPEQAQGLRILEIGSGMSPLKHFYPDVRTSDVMPLDYIDYVLDAHHIGRFDEIEPESVDIIALTNVLHHLQDPVEFLMNAEKKLRPGGRIMLVEPYFSFLSRLIYVHLHHEPTDFTISAPRLRHITGPLSSANIAIPHLIFWG